MNIQDLEKRPACEFERDEIVVRLRDLKAKISELPTNDDGKQSEEEYIMEWAWSVISNALDGDWDKANLQWKRAAELWRDRYFAYLHHKVVEEAKP